MRILACILLCVYAVAARSGYADVKYGGYVDLHTPYKGCHYVGQYLKHPKDECMFLRCDYGNEPWKDQYGKIQLFAREMRCANGLSVGYGYSQGYDNPCDTPNKKCFVYPKKTHSYHEVDTKAVYNSYDDSHSGYAKKEDYKAPVHYAPKQNTHYEVPNTYDNSYDTHTTKHNSYEPHKADYNTHKSGYDTHKNEYEPQYPSKSEYDHPKSEYDTHKSGYDTGYKSGYDNKKTSYEQHVYSVHDAKHPGYPEHSKKNEY